MRGRVQAARPISLPRAKTPSLHLGRHADHRRARDQAAPRSPALSGTPPPILQVDRETGDVVIDRHITVSDVGKALNPMQVRGQDEGAAIMGLGHTLMEHYIYDETGRIRNLGAIDYRIPTSMDLPLLIEIVDSEENIRAALPELDALIETAGCGGLVTLERAEVIRYAHGGKGSFTDNDQFQGVLDDIWVRIG